MSQLTIEQYFGKWLTHPDANAAVKNNADLLIEKVNVLIQHVTKDDVIFPINPHTGSIVSGETFGGFRPQSCAIGAPKSAHKGGEAVDIYDPHNEIDGWLLRYSMILPQFGLYFEHPSATPRWSHWGIRRPGSGNRFFYP